MKYRERAARARSLSRARVTRRVLVAVAMLAPAFAIGLTSLPAEATTPLTSTPMAGAITWNGNSGDCVANLNGVDPGTGASNPVQLSTCNGEIGHQIWTIEPDGQIRIFFLNNSNGSVKCLLGNSSGVVVLWACNSSAGEQWDLTGTASIHQAVSSSPSLCLATDSTLNDQLTLATCSTSNSDQQWTLPSATSAANQAATAALGQLAMYDPSTGLFTDNIANSCGINANQWVNAGNNLHYQFAGNCWWWSAVALNSLIDFDDQASGTQWTYNSGTGTWSPPSGTPWSGGGSADTSIISDLATTYNAICGTAMGPATGAPGTPDNGQCPVRSAGDPSTDWTSTDDDGLPAYQDPQEWPNQFENNFFDDTANWAVMWVNAYQLTGKTNYLYLAESLWYYITKVGWDSGNHDWPQTASYPNFPGRWQYTWQCDAGSQNASVAGVSDDPGNPNSSAGVAQFVQPNNGGAGDYGEASKNVGANTLYLWLSASLYSLTGNSDFFDGVFNSNASADEGGLYQEAQWLLNTSNLVHEYGTGDLDASGTKFVFDGEINPDPTATPPATPPQPCNVATGETKETQHMGTAVGGLAAMYPAIEKASEQTSGIPADYTANFASDKSGSEQFYLDVAKNLADTVIGATSTSYGGPQFIDGTTPGDNVLSEQCNTTGANWPDGCAVTDGMKNHWLPGKGIFTRAAYCLNRDLTEAGLPDTGIGTFITGNASSIWSNDQNTSAPAGELDANQFGFMWDNNLFQSVSPTANTAWPASPSTQPGMGYATQASALEGLSAHVGGSTAMCDGHLTS